ncbi:hypothetical protein [Bradyrhizobium shewense]|nr:hypothetical protein [Bradyrhizobium shewense]
MLSLADDESFVIMVWAVDAAQSGRAETASRLLSFPKEVREAKFGERYFVFKWALETLVNELLSIKKRGAPPIGRPGRRLDCSKFETVAQCINTLRELEDAEDGMVLSQFNVLSVMHKIGHRQFEWQRGFFSYSQIYRTLAVFGGDLAKHYFESTYQISIAKFFECGFAFFALCQTHPGFRTNVNLTEVGLSPEVCDRALKLLSSPIEVIRAEAITIRKADGSTAYQASVLRKAPLLIFHPNVARAPLPSLILQRLTAGLYYDLVGGGSHIWREIGARFESYCLELSTAILPELKPTGSFHYKFGKQYDSPDLFLHDQSGRACVVVECKAKKMSLAAKFSDDPMTSASAAFSEIIKGVVQIWRFHSHCRRNPTIKDLAPSSMGVLLTLDPWLQMSNQHERVFEEAIKIADQIDPDIIDDDRKPILFCSIDDFENTLEVASEKSFLEALNSSASPKFRGWFLFNVHQAIGAQEKKNPYPFADRVAGLLPGWNDNLPSPSG